MEITKKELARFVKFGLVGFLGAGVTYFFWILLEVFLGFPDRMALVIGIEIAIISNFFINNFWTFRDRPKKERIFLKLLKFNLVSLGGLLINVIVYTIFRDYFEFYKYFAEVFGILGGFLWNFFINNFWTWKK